MHSTICWKTPATCVSSLPATHGSMHHRPTCPGGRVQRIRRAVPQHLPKHIWDWNLNGTLDWLRLRCLLSSRLYSVPPLLSLSEQDMTRTLDACRRRRHDFDILFRQQWRNCLRGQLLRRRSGDRGYVLVAVCSPANSDHRILLRPVHVQTVTDSVMAEEAWHCSS